MSTLLGVFGAILAVFVIYTVLAPVVLNFPRFLGKKAVPCPNLHQEGAIVLKPFGAAFSAGYGTPKLEISDCSLWSKQLLCQSECLEGQTF